MTTAFAPRTAQPGQRLSYADAAGNFHRLQAEEIEEGRWVFQPETNADEAAMRRHRLPIDEGLAAQQAEERAANEKLVGDALDARGRELEIEGFSSMRADDKRAAIAAREAEATDGTTDGADGPSQEE